MFNNTLNGVQKLLDGGICKQAAYIHTKYDVPLPVSVFINDKQTDVQLYGQTRKDNKWEIASRLRRMERGGQSIPLMIH